jgi:hypothetical protein
MTGKMFCPFGTSDNSPAIYGWVNRPKPIQSPLGTTETLLGLSDIKYRIRIYQCPSMVKKAFLRNEPKLKIAKYYQSARYENSVWLRFPKRTHFPGSLRSRRFNQVQPGQGKLRLAMFHVASPVRPNHFEKKNYFLPLVFLVVKIRTPFRPNPAYSSPPSPPLKVT